MSVGDDVASDPVSTETLLVARLSELSATTPRTLTLVWHSLTVPPVLSALRFRVSLPSVLPCSHQVDSLLVWPVMDGSTHTRSVGGWYKASINSILG